MEKHGANSALTSPLPPASCAKSLFFFFFPEFSHVAGVESCLQEEDFHAEKLLSSSSVGVYKSSALPSPQPRFSDIDRVQREGEIKSLK